jgi:hypothetical protein
MTSAALKPLNIAGIEPDTQALLDALWADYREGRDPDWTPAHRDHVAVYRRYVAALRLYRGPHRRRVADPGRPVPAHGSGP